MTHDPYKSIRYDHLSLNQRINLKAYILEHGETDPALKGVYACYKFFGFVQAINFLFSGEMDSTKEMWI